MNTDALNIGLAVAADLPAINDIYNHYVLNSTATYQEDLETLESRQAWFDRHGPAHPVTVARISSTIAGWASLSPYHPRSAYRRTVECSVYVDSSTHRRGLGRALMLDIISRARAAGHHTIIALIDAEQAPSLSLHELLGFVRVALLREVGFKFGRWLDVIYMQLML
jgi:L-amino acid N-acyltransferase YncA